MVFSGVIEGVGDHIVSRYFSAGKTKSLQTLGEKVGLALHVGGEGHLGGEISY